MSKALYRAMSFGYLRLEILYCFPFSCITIIARTGRWRDERITFIAPPALVLKATLDTGRAVGYIFIAADFTDTTFNATCMFARPTDLCDSLLAYLPFAGCSHSGMHEIVVDRGLRRSGRRSGIAAIRDRDGE